MTERYEFLYVKRCHITTFTEAWRSYEEQEHRGGEQPPDDSRGRPPMSAASSNPSRAPPTAPCAGKAEEKAVPDAPKKKHKTDAESAAGKRSPDQIKETSALADAARLKADFIATVAAAKQLVRQIEENPEWSWARNKETAGTLQERLATVENMIKGDMTQLFLEEIAAIRASIGAKALLALCQELRVVEEPLRLLRAKLQECLNMQKARAKSSSR